MPDLLIGNEEVGCVLGKFPSSWVFEELCPPLAKGVSALAISNKTVVSLTIVSFFVLLLSPSSTSILFTGNFFPPDPSVDFVVEVLEEAVLNKNSSSSLEIKDANTSCGPADEACSRLSSLSKGSNGVCNLAT